MTAMTARTPPKRAHIKDPTIWPRTRAEAEKLVHDIRTGLYRPGEPLPSARTFAEGKVKGYAPMAIWTVTGVFKLVQEAGVVEVPRGRRMQVLPYADWPKGLYDPAIIVERPEPPVVEDTEDAAEDAPGETAEDASDQDSANRDTPIEADTTEVLTP